MLPFLSIFNKSKYEKPSSEEASAIFRSIVYLGMYTGIPKL